MQWIIELVDLFSYQITDQCVHDRWEPRSGKQFLKEGTLNAILAWQEQATKKTAPKNKSGRHSRGHRLGGIMGLNKTKDGEGHIRDIALLGHHTQPHSSRHGHPHEQSYTHHGKYINQL